MRSESNAKSFGWTAVGFLLLVNLIAVSFFFSPGTGDVGTWGHWMSEISESGLIRGYVQSDTDYPPLAFVILAGVVKCAAAFGATPFVVLKSSLLLFLWISAGCFYWFTRDLGLTAGFELAITLSSMGLGYLDIYVVPFLIAGLFHLQRGNLNRGILLFALSCFTKWQPLIIAPFVCLYILGAPAERAPERNHRLKARIIPFAAAAFAVAIPFLLIFDGKIFDSLHRAMTYHKFLSGYALNLGWIQTWLLHLFNPEKYGELLQGGAIDAVIVRDPLIVWPNKVLFCLSYAAILFVFTRQTKSFERLIIYSMLGYLVYFSFNTGVHENHLFLVCCLAWVLVFFEPRQLLRCINLCIAANANLFLFFGAFGQRIDPVIAGIDITLLFVVANLCLFAGFLLHTFKADGVGLKFWQS